MSAGHHDAARRCAIAGLCGAPDLEQAQRPVHPRAGGRGLWRTARWRSRSAAQRLRTRIAAREATGSCSGAICSPASRVEPRRAKRMRSRSRATAKAKARASPRNGFASPRRSDRRCRGRTCFSRYGSLARRSQISIFTTGGRDAPDSSCPHDPEDTLVRSSEGDVDRRSSQRTALRRDVGPVRGHQAPLARRGAAPPAHACAGARATLAAGHLQPEQRSGRPGRYIPAILHSASAMPSPSRSTTTRASA